MKTATAEKILGACVFLFVGFFLLLFGVALLGSGGTEDLSVFHRWLSKAFNTTIADGYRNSGGDYPPFLAFTFYPVAFLKDGIGYWTVIHLSIVFNLLLSTFILYRITKNPLISIVFYFSVFYPSVILKYLDIHYTPWLLLSLLFLMKKHYFWFGLFFMGSCLVKWQPLILAPFMALYLFLQPSTSRNPLLNLAPWKAALGACCTLFVCLLYFGASTMLGALNTAVNEPELSGQGMNLYWIVTHWLHVNHPAQYGPLDQGLINIIIPDRVSLTYAKTPFVIFYLLTLIAFWRQAHTFENLLYFSMIAFFTYFVLNTGVHENHLYVPVLLGFWLMSLHSRYFVIAVPVIIAYNFNVLIFEGFGRWLVTIQRTYFEIDVTLLGAWMILGFWFIYWMMQILPLLIRKNSSAVTRSH